MKKTGFKVLEFEGIDDNIFKYLLDSFVREGANEHRLSIEVESEYFEFIIGFSGRMPSYMTVSHTARLGLNGFWGVFPDQRKGHNFIYYSKKDPYIEYLRGLSEDFIIFDKEYLVHYSLHLDDKSVEVVAEWPPMLKIINKRKLPLEVWKNNEFNPFKFEGFDSRFFGAVRCVYVEQDLKKPCEVYFKNEKYRFIIDFPVRPIVIQITDREFSEAGRGFQLEIDEALTEQYLIFYTKDSDYLDENRFGFKSVLSEEEYENLTHYALYFENKVIDVLSYAQPNFSIGLRNQL